MFKVYQVKPSDTNPGFFKVIKAYFIYDRREEHVYQEYEAQLDALNREEGSNPRAERTESNPNSRSNSRPNQIEIPPVNRVNRIGDQQSPTLIRSSMREWVLRSPSPNVNDDSQKDQSGSANKDSRNPSDDLNDVGGRKRVESFEIDFGGLSRSNSSGSIPENLPNGKPIKDNLFLRSFDSIDKTDEVQKSTTKDDSSTKLSNAGPLPPLRPRGRSYDSNRGNSPYLQPADKPSLNPIDEREDEHHYD